MSNWWFLLGTLFILSLAIYGVFAIIEDLGAKNGQIERQTSITNGGLPIVQGSILASISSPLSEKETILWEVANTYNYPEEVLDKLWACESQRRHEGVWGQAGEYGAFQFMPRTFYSFAENFGLEDYSLFNFRHQATLTTLMLKAGYQNHWMCWKKI